jgi:hypothetical protein
LLDVCQRGGFIGFWSDFLMTGLHKTELISCQWGDMCWKYDLAIEHKQRIYMFLFQEKHIISSLPSLVYASKQSHARKKVPFGCSVAGKLQVIHHP